MGEYFIGFRISEGEEYPVSPEYQERSQPSTMSVHTR